MSEPTVINLDIDFDTLRWIAICAITGISLLVYKDDFVEWCSKIFKLDPVKTANIIIFGILGIAVTLIPILISKALHIMWIGYLSYAFFLAVIIGLRIYGSRK